MSLWRFLFPKKPDLAKTDGLRCELASAVSRHAIAARNSTTATEEFRRHMGDLLDTMKVETAPDKRPAKLQ